MMYVRVNKHSFWVYFSLFKRQQREPDRSKEIEQRKESQNTRTQTKQGHVTLSTDYNLLH